MKALFLTKEYPPNVYGGAGVHVEYLSKELARLMDVEVRCFGNQKEASGNLAVQGLDFSPEVFKNCDKQLKSPLTAMHNCISFNATPIDAQLVHCHTWYSHLGGIVAQKAYGIPFFLTTHSLEPLRPWKREQLGLGYDLSVWIEKTAMESADAIIAVSNGMKDDILRFFNVDPQRISVIYNGIDIEEYQQTDKVDALERYGVDPGKPIVLFVGRITRQKGIIHLVNAIKHINDEAQIVLCAGEPDTPGIKNEMEEGVRQVSEKRKNIIWIQKMLSKKDIIQFYSHASVFCCPSIYEPFGIINLEAMACRTPVVASAVGGIVEIVQPGKTGTLVQFEQYQQSPFEPVNPPEFSKSLADAINKILDDKALMKSMGDFGRARVEEKFSWASIAKQTFELYKRHVK
ncbi:MAG: glycogen synthase [Magnetococcales bacterium]|nr:glycogen synthase [Magnetococcales bacterium]MBF0149551.1 glycogen synthase [Magnetococcales bacterium]MBF0173485.1 glycogen synthase [Magnetococcales bacterium]MBF0346906.1 glycogen synthase [Magnetococcales bacterium]MBF0631938.1 glycogen synthase [Magnetococcales bacterium]